ncbi:MAG: extracellular solute-binding protein [Chloroflexota bacterium]|nr:extracellular solute-binding protein [Chloroflexota bacterium]
MRSTPTYPDVVKWGIEQFTQRHPHVTVETTQNAGDVEKTLALMVAGEGPDVFHAWRHRMWQYAAKGQMYNHNELLRDLKKADIDDFVDFQWKGLVIPNTNFRFGIPTYVNMVVLYYNKALFAQRGQREPTADWTHDEYATMLKRMTFEDAGRLVWGGWTQAANFDRFQAHVIMYGGHVVDPKDLTKSVLGEAKAQQGLEWLRARYWQDRSFAPLDDALRTGQRPVSHFAEVKPQLDRAAGSCGITFG